MKYLALLLISALGFGCMRTGYSHRTTHPDGSVTEEEFVTNGNWNLEGEQVQEVGDPAATPTATIPGVESFGRSMAPGRMAQSQHPAELQMASGAVLRFRTLDHSTPTLAQGKREAEVLNRVVAALIAYWGFEWAEAREATERAVETGKIKLDGIKSNNDVEKAAIEAAKDVDLKRIMP